MFTIVFAPATQLSLSTTAMIERAAAIVGAVGFSRRMCFPASAAAIACWSFLDEMYTASMSLCGTDLRSLVTTYGVLRPKGKTLWVGAEQGRHRDSVSAKGGHHPVGNDETCAGKADLETWQWHRHLLDYHGEPARGSVGCVPI